MDYSTMQNTPNKRNHTLVSSAFILGILSIISAFTCFGFLTPILAGLGILFCILSKGHENSYEKKAKQGLILSTISMVFCVIIMIAGIIFAFITISKYDKSELHDYLNDAYEQTYGKSFDEVYEKIYGDNIENLFEIEEGVK